MINNIRLFYYTISQMNFKFWKLINFNEKRTQLPTAKIFTRTQIKSNENIFYLSEINKWAKLLLIYTFILMYFSETIFWNFNETFNMKLYCWPVIISMRICAFLSVLKEFFSHKLAVETILALQLILVVQTRVILWQ